MQTLTEQLGSFYLGSILDSGAPDSGAPLLYDARDLTTHAVCVGMTGSGKTGLCIDLLEEAALDKVPALLIDPKGDITNLLLQFPELRPEDFQPWVNVDDARRKGQTVEEYSQSTAELWRNGLAKSGIEGARIQTLGESADFTIFTPGSDAGIGVNVMGSMAAPSGNFDDDAEMLRERISGTVAALLGLVDVDADPVRSGEGILLATIFEHAWRNGEDLDLAKLILAIQTPPVEKLGVFDLETFYPAADRLDLAMAFNSLVASPAFSEWLRGEPLDVQALLYLDDGTPRHSVFYLAHLSDRERMFFVTLLLENVITWMRGQSGTTSLRALLYFDEVFGFFPPTAEPPSKRPLLTIMKQGRAFGLGAVLVTQNPVDIDYKGLANAGTWFIGKMQTERDKARVLAGLEGAISEAGGAAADTDFDSLITGLGSRVFLMHNVHADAPQVFHTRWAMSYLRGPLTRPQVRTLMEQAGKRDQNTARQESGSTSAVPAEDSRTESPAAVAPEGGAEMPAGYRATPWELGPDIPQFYLPANVSPGAAWRRLDRDGHDELNITRRSFVYLPGLLGRATVHFVDQKWGVDAERDYVLWLPLDRDAGAVEWADAADLGALERELATNPSTHGGGEGPYFAELPQRPTRLSDFRSAEKDLSDWLYAYSRYPLLSQGELGLAQAPGESERDFLVRVRQAAREARDADVDALEEKYEARIDRVQEAIDAASRKVSSLESDLSSRRQQEMIGFGANALDVFLSRRSARAFSGVGSRRRMTVKAHDALAAAQDKVEDLNEDMAELQAELEAAGADITIKWAGALDRLETIELKPRRVDVEVQPVAVGWAPYWLLEVDGRVGAQSALAPACGLLQERATLG